MSLRIKTNVDSLIAQRHLSENYAALGSSIEKLSSGERINRSADDAAGLAISESFKAKIRGLNQARRNANDGVSFVEVAESGLTQMTNMVIRLRELTVQAASDTMGLEERSYLDKEYQELVQEIQRISDQTEFNGQKLLAPGAQHNLSIQVGYSNTPNDVLHLKLGDDSVDGINSEVLGLNSTTLMHEERQAVADNLNIIDTGLTVIARARATLGGTESRLNTAIESISMRVENMEAANSRIRDVDYAAETAVMVKERMLTQANISVLQTANMMPDMALSLLRQ